METDLQSHCFGFDGGFIFVMVPFLFPTQEEIHSGDLPDSMFAACGMNGKLKKICMEASSVKTILQVPAADECPKCIGREWHLHAFVERFGKLELLIPLCQTWER